MLTCVNRTCFDPCDPLRARGYVSIYITRAIFDLLYLLSIGATEKLDPRSFSKRN